MMNKKKELPEFLEGKVPEVNDNTLRTYRAYLKNNLEIPCFLTGIEDFSWEERYVFGYGSKIEYEKLKKTRASYTDTFKLLDLDNEIDEGYGILANVRRVSDKRKFDLPLADLKTTDEQSKNYQLLDDFSVWFVNYR
ncbi:MAG: calcium-binding protein [Candidatus Competibacteraceae bacterium]